MFESSQSSNQVKPLPDIVILGGGTAGWMTANLMIAQWPNANITLVESPDIATIGVGEGSTPQLKSFFDKIGVLEKEWMPACNATYKNGILFKDWSHRNNSKSYFHPFTSLIDAHSAPAFMYNTLYRRQGIAIDCHPDRFFLSAALAQQEKAPIGQYQFPFDIGYGYHFDAALLGHFLTSVATKKGVQHVKGLVEQVTLSAPDKIQSLVLQDGRQYQGSLFVDCSGFKGKLIQETLKVKFISFKENLFNDSAVAIQVPYLENIDTIASQTVSTALKYGWMWQIPLTNRTGTGYVYSSEYCRAEQAEKELRDTLGLDGEQYNAKHIKMKVGRVDSHWFGNCLAVGLSQGFIEPLEATALHFVQETIENFITSYEKGGFTTQFQSSFNQQLNARFEGIRDYIVAHYRLSDREDTSYWRKNSENANISNHLKKIVSSWMNGENLEKYLLDQSVVSFYPPVSWYAILAGYGVFPPVKPETTQNHQILRDAYKYDLAHIDQFISRCAINYDDHLVQLNAMVNIARQ